MFEMMPCSSFHFLLLDLGANDTLPLLCFGQFPKAFFFLFRALYVCRKVNLLFFINYHR
jgi:hypothetical protein